MVDQQNNAHLYFFARRSARPFSLFQSSLSTLLKLLTFPNRTPLSVSLPIRLAFIALILALPLLQQELGSSPFVRFAFCSWSLRSSLIDPFIWHPVKYDRRPSGGLVAWVLSGRSVWVTLFMLVALLIWVRSVRCPTPVIALLPTSAIGLLRFRLARCGRLFRFQIA